MKRILLSLFYFLCLFNVLKAEDVTVYYVNYLNAENIFAHVWGTGGATNWPGVPAKKTSEFCRGYEVYSYTCDYDMFQNIIFNDYGVFLTGELKMNPSKPYFYKDKWYVSLKEIENEAEVEVQIDGLNFSLDINNKTAEVTRLGQYVNNVDVIIPESVTYDSQTYVVKSIGSFAFYKCSSLTSITIPSSIISVGNQAFEGCDGITKVNYLGTTDKWATIDFRSSEISSPEVSNPTFYAKDLYINNELLTDVTITEANSIGSCAFYNCKSIKSVELNSAVTTIGSKAFEGCDGITKVNYLGTIDKWAVIDFMGGLYSNPTSYAKDLYINNELLTDVKITEADSIKDCAFENCASIKSVEIGNSVTSVGNYAFWGCSGLKSVIIPNSVTCIGYAAFSGCSGLTKVNYLGTVDQWVEIDLKNRMSNPIYYAKNLYINNELLTDVKITEADSIKDCAFENCASIKSVEIGESVTTIGDDAFMNCIGLTSVTIPNSVTSIGINAFSGCIGLTSVTIPNSVTSIGTNAFSGCSGLTSVTIPNSVTSIAPYAFSNCIGLTSITIPNSVISIGYAAFSDCSGLTKVNYLGTVDQWAEINFGNEDANPMQYAASIYINSKLLEDLKITQAEAIKAYAFVNCQSIKSVEIGESVTSIGDYAFYGCSGLTSIIIPNSVPSIGDYAFYACSGLTSITIPNTVTSIGDYAFYGCSGLTSVTIPNSLTSIGDYAFQECSKLTSLIWNAERCEHFLIYDPNPKNLPFDNLNITSLIIGNEVKFIPDYLFYGINNLTSVVWNAKNYNGSFDELPNNITSITFGNEVKHIPSSLCKNMSKLTGIIIPNSVASIGDDAFSGCSGLTSVVWNAKNCKDFSMEASPFYYSRSNITSFTLGSEVEYIPSYLCEDMSKLTGLIIPNSVTSIGDGAFSGCSGLTSVVWNAKNCKDFSMEASPFYYSRSNITSFTLGSEVEYIPSYLCEDMSKLTGLIIPKSVTSIGDDAFYGCSGLTSVVWNAKNCKDFSMEASPFYYSRSKITSFTLGNEVEYIPSYLCYEMSKLTEITIPNSVTSIGTCALGNCSELKSVSIGERVNTIGAEVFVGCENLKKITMYPMNVPSTQGTETFAHYNAYLYVPCAVYEDYDLDDVFGNFKYIKCIVATVVDAPDKVEIEVGDDNNAIIVWPSTDGAKSYELEITKNGKVFCTLLFNENGQLTSIDFGNRAASVGFQFIVTGLDGASKYNYSMVSMDKKGNELQSYKGTFTTNGYVPGPGEEDEPSAIIETLADANITISNGLITVADADFSIYNLAGQNVTALNGNLLPGVYMVSLNGNIAKVMVK